MRSNRALIDKARTLSSTFHRFQLWIVKAETFVMKMNALKLAALKNAQPDAIIDVRINDLSNVEPGDINGVAVGDWTEPAIVVEPATADLDPTQ